ncbi:MAG: N-acetyl sugar amidotransferase [Deltaproteobacteria bacterium]|nr:N-acetyl sugar amidotransferase [Deltaproteobacteria bacterium]
MVLSQYNSFEVKYCKKCVVSNQRPRIEFNSDGVCAPCLYAEQKQRSIDWAKREGELVALLDQYRSKDGSYDVIVPASGGKDSSYIAHMLKTKYGMHPLLTSVAPNMWTDVGWENLTNLVDAGFDQVMMRPSGQVYRKFSRLAFEHFGDPFLPFGYLVKAFPIRMAIQYRIPLVMYAEDGEVEYGGDTKNQHRGTIDYDSDMVRQYFSGFSPESWMKYGLTYNEIQSFMLPTFEEIKQARLDYRYFAYYRKWVPQENYYYAAEHVNLKPNPMRNEGTYSKYASFDDKLDGFHFYMAYIKFGIGRATSDAAHEVRDGHITREEAVALVHKYDGEFPARYFRECLDYMDITESEFEKIVDNYRRPHLWEKTDGKWILKHRVS